MNIWLTIRFRDASQLLMSFCLGCLGGPSSLQSFTGPRRLPGHSGPRSETWATCCEDASYHSRMPTLVLLVLWTGGGRVWVATSLACGTGEVFLSQKMHFRSCWHLINKIDWNSAFNLKITSLLLKCTTGIHRECANGEAGELSALSLLIWNVAKRCWKDSKWV